MQKAASSKPVLMAPNAPREHHSPITSSSSATSQTSTVVPAHNPISDGMSSSEHNGNFKFRDVVLGKVQGYPPWPGIVSGGGFCIVPIHWKFTKHRLCIRRIYHLIPRKNDLPWKLLLSTASSSFQLVMCTSPCYSSVYNFIYWSLQYMGSSKGYI